MINIQLPTIPAPRSALIGDLYQCEDQVYVLAKVDSRYVAINIETGGIWDIPQDTIGAAIRNLTPLPLRTMVTRTVE